MVEIFKVKGGKIFTAFHFQNCSVKTKFNCVRSASGIDWSGYIRAIPISTNFAPALFNSCRKPSLATVDAFCWKTAPAANSSTAEKRSALPPFGFGNFLGIRGQSSSISSTNLLTFPPTIMMLCSLPVWFIVSAVSWINKVRSTICCVISTSSFARGGSGCGFSSARECGMSASKISSRPLNTPSDKSVRHASSCGKSRCLSSLSRSPANARWIYESQGPGDGGSSGFGKSFPPNI